MTPSKYLVLLIVAITAPLGDTLLSRGMKEFGPVSLHHPVMLVQALFTPYVGLGILLLIAFFASYTAALSWADLTYVLPTTSIGNVVIALLARFWLHEPISLSRWLGILLITMGVGFVANGKSFTETEDRAKSPDLHAGASSDLTRDLAIEPSSSMVGSERIIQR
jgi:drug/metabolite transporter (DMT)-like permease